MQMISMMWLSIAAANLVRSEGVLHRKYILIGLPVIDGLLKPVFHQKIHFNMAIRSSVSNCGIGPGSKGEHIAQVLDSLYSDTTQIVLPDLA